MADEKDAMDSAGAIFGVSKKKKKKTAPEEAAAAEATPAPSAESDAPAPSADNDALAAANAELELAKAKLAAAEAQAKLAALEAKTSGTPAAADEDDDEAAAAPAKEEEKAAPTKAAAKPPAADEKKDAVAGIFNPSSGGDAEYLGGTDLGDYEPAEKASAMPWVIGIVVVTLISAVVLMQFGSAGDVAAVAKGELRENRLAEKQKTEEDYKKAQLEALDRFGVLIINGAPQYADITIDGRPYFGQAKADCPECPYLRMRLGPSAVFQHMKVKEKHSIVVASPGFETKTFEVTEGQWQANPSGGDATYMLTANLDPVSIETKAEFDSRLLPDVDTEYFGKVSLKSTPPGAKIIWNGKPLMDAKGTELTTPVEFEKYYTKNDKGRLEEQMVNVDTVLDLGHTVTLEPADPKLPKFRMAIQRQMWTCTFDESIKLKDDDSFQKKCKYDYALDFDFQKLADFIKWRAEEEARVKEKNKKIQAELLKKAQGEEG